MGQIVNVILLFHYVSSFSGFAYVFQACLLKM